MSPRTVAATLRSNLPTILAALALLTAIGVVTNPVQALNERMRVLELKVDTKGALRDSTIAEVRRYARAAAIDLCLTRPDSVTARMDLNCRKLLNR